MNKRLSRRDIQRGYGNADRPVLKTLWEQEGRTDDPTVFETGNYEPSRTKIDFKRYYDPVYADQEIDKLFLKTWLFACREEDIPQVGDRAPFHVGRVSFLIIRTSNNSFKAFFNSCLHRGTRLCAKPQGGDTIRCPYHAWEWRLDGTLKNIPSHWDFKSINPTNGALREVKLGRWGGFIYINADPNSASFEEALGPIPEHFKEYDIENRYTAARFRKLVAANWKIAQEAFIESYHVIGTHPQAICYNGDSQAQYDIWPNANGGVGRQVTPASVPSMHAPADASPVVAAEVHAAGMKAWHYPDAGLPNFDPKKNIRAQLAQWHREVQTKFYGVSREGFTDSVMLDSLLYFIFPQSCIWMSESVPFTYQFTPHPTDPEKSYFEVRTLRPVPAGGPRPPSSPAIEVGIDELIEEKVPAFSFLGGILDQDMANMPEIQAGVKAADPTRHYAVPGTYQEMLLQHWHDIFDRYMAG